MRKSIGVAVLLSALVIAGSASSQGMLLDFAADKVLKKYAAATCEQLKAHIRRLAITVNAGFPDGGGSSLLGGATRSRQRR